MKKYILLLLTFLICFMSFGFTGHNTTGQYAMSSMCSTIVDGYDDTATSVQSFGDGSNVRAGGSFTASKNYTTCKILVRLSEAGTAGGTVTGRLYDDSSGLPNTLLETAAESYTNAEIGSTSAFFTFTFSQALTNATRYHVVVVCSQTNDVSNNFRLHYLNTGTEIVSRYGAGWIATDTSATARILTYE